MPQIPAMLVAKEPHFLGETSADLGVAAIGV
jgi:hypothetical protein